MTQVGECLQVGDDAALVPQEAAVTQFDGRNQRSPAVSLRLVTEGCEEKQKTFRKGS